MAFPNSSAPAFDRNTAAAGNVQIRTGPDLPEISTEGFGFQSIAGEAKVRLFPAPWPADNLPPSTASLLSVASKNGLLAAAGPESVAIASTDTVRRAYTESSGDGNVKNFTPQLSLNLGVRVSQVAFSADEKFLVLSAQEGGGLAVYEVANLMNGSAQSSFELSTNGMPLRHLIPNPFPQKAELFALVTTTGQLIIANLSTRELLHRGQEFIMREGVSCISWSSKGKQLVAGLGNGTVVQMTPEGEEKGVISRPPFIEGDQYVSSILWLENEIFLIAHTPTLHEPGMPPVTSYTLITRGQPQTEITFQKLPEPCFPSGLDRPSPYQYMQRLRDFRPDLKDAVIIVSTGSEDIGLITRSATPLSSDIPADQANIYTTTSMADDSRRAQMPMDEGMQSTSPIGVALDLSGKDKVPRPLPKEEFDESAGPLPALMILNNEGILMTWWLVYAESIRQKESYHGLAALGEYQVQQPQGTQHETSSFTSSGHQAGPAFGQAAFGQPSKPAFGVNSAPNGNFGSTSSAPTFGQSGVPAAPPKLTSAPAFGSPTPMSGGASGPVFGQTGGLARSSPWGTPQTGSAAASGSAFGQTGSLGIKSNVFGGTSSASPFGSAAAAGGSPAPTSGFASFAGKPSPFMTTGTMPTQSVFSQPSINVPMNSSAINSSPFGQPASKNEAPKSPFGSGSTFTLGSTFKSDTTAANDASKPTDSSMFGSNFGDALGKVEMEDTQTKDEDMVDESQEVIEEKPKEQNTHENTVEASKSSETPILTSQPQQTAPFKSSDFTGVESQSALTPAEAANSKPVPTWSFGEAKPDDFAPREIHVKTKDLPTPQTSPKIKAEPDGSDNESTKPLPEAPLPPESTSKTSFAPGDSSNSSKSSNEEPPEPPLPPDPFPIKSKLSNVESASEEPPLPPQSPSPVEAPSDTEEPQVEQTEIPGSDDEAEGSDDEDEDIGDDESSGVDVAQEISSPSDHTQSPKISSENSFSRKGGPNGDLFSQTAPQDLAAKGPSLFGEVDKSSAVFGKPVIPFFPPPAKSQQSPRSPSPVRQSHLSMDSLRPDNARSVSAPGLSNTGFKRRAIIGQLVVPQKQAQNPGLNLRKQEEEHFAAQKAKQAAEEEQSLSDNEDELIRHELQTPVRGSRSLDPFLAHQDYVGQVDKTGIPGQIEKVYRDINSMIDTLGLNARSLTAFVKGHSEQIDDEGISTDDLDHPDDFALDEIPKLVALEYQLSNDLDSHRLQDIQNSLSVCRETRKDLQSLRHKRNEITKTIEFSNDPKSVESTGSAPLSLEQASQQHDLRKKFAHFQKSLAQAEEDIILLRAKLASCDKISSSRLSSSVGSVSMQKKPTVEAVTKTILKMTSMIERKSGDIDVLEAQLRSLRLPSVEFGHQSRSSREGSPITTSNMKKGGAATPSFGSSPLRRSINGESSTKRVPTASIVTQEAEKYRSKAERRKEINALVRETFEKSGPRIRPLE